MAWPKGKSPSEETRRKIGESKKGNAYTKGHKLSDEHRAKISKSLLGTRNGAGNKGKPKSEEHRKKIEIASKGNKSFTGRKHSEETKRKMSESGIKRFTRPGEREKLAKSRRQFTIDGATKRGGNFLEGYHLSTKVDGKFYYMSSYELRLCKLLDIMDNVSCYSRSDSIPYTYNGIRHEYYPDFLIYYKDGSFRIVEVKPAWFVTNDPAVVAKNEAALDAYGNDFVIVTKHELEMMEAYVTIGSTPELLAYDYRSIKTKVKITKQRRKPKLH